uniref:Uncharacterized protein n=1 Tax=Parastrongyloides trichosuri TaxID=131310 RepID=A0A0N4ZPV1_PARTI
MFCIEKTMFIVYIVRILSSIIILISFFIPKCARPRPTANRSNQQNRISKSCECTKSSTHECKSCHDKRKKRKKKRKSDMEFAIQQTPQTKLTTSIKNNNYNISIKKDVTFPLKGNGLPKDNSPVLEPTQKISLIEAIPIPNSPVGTSQNEGKQKNEQDYLKLAVQPPTGGTIGGNIIEGKRSKPTPPSENISQDKLTLQENQLNKRPSIKPDVIKKIVQMEPAPILLLNKNNNSKNKNGDTDKVIQGETSEIKLAESLFEKKTEKGMVDGFKKVEIEVTKVKEEPEKIKRKSIDENIKPNKEIERRKKPSETKDKPSPNVKSIMKKEKKVETKDTKESKECIVLPDNEQYEDLGNFDIQESEKVVEKKDEPKSLTSLMKQKEKQKLSSSQGGRTKIKSTPKIKSDKDKEKDKGEKSVPEENIEMGPDNKYDALPDIDIEQLKGKK